MEHCGAGGKAQGTATTFSSAVLRAADGLRLTRAGRRRKTGTGASTRI